MLNDLDLGNILFLDIETVPQHSHYGELDERLKKLWDKKAKTLRDTEEQDAEEVYRRAGIYAEFGKIVCISVGFFNKREFRVKSFYGHDEEEILRNFAKMINSYFSDYLLCAHNGKEFDFPYIARRMIINRIELPSLLDIAGKKPWEVRHLDTMELWKFGDFKAYTSLDLLTAVFGIPSPKDDIDGSEVWRVYWQEKDLERIKTYCQKDVVSLAQVFLAYRLEPKLQEADVVYV